MNLPDSPQCPACAQRRSRSLFSLPEVPVNSVLLMRTREEAIQLPQHKLTLVLCDSCGFAWNDSFDADAVEYSDRYEESQSHSPAFRLWHEQLALQLVERHNLRGKDVVEIGCGKGEFLAELCRIGSNHGIGIDPGYVQERGASHPDAQFLIERFGAGSALVSADMIVCKMTLEHVPRVAELVQTLRRKIDPATNPVVFFQVPDARRIFEEGAFWDIYFEHCSYFTAGALALLFERAGFFVNSVRREYDNQYLTIEATTKSGGSEMRVDDLLETRALGTGFEERASEMIHRWRNDLTVNHQDTVLWGAGSKAVAFLSALGPGIGVERAVDINPHKDGFFLPGSAVPIVSPKSLTRQPPGRVIVMNPYYEREIVDTLAALGLYPEVLTVNEAPGRARPVTLHSEIQSLKANPEQKVMQHG